MINFEYKLNEYFALFHKINASRCKTGTLNFYKYAFLLFYDCMSELKQNAFME